jgi:SAM-dependent methyltransferase
MSIAKELVSLMRDSWDRRIGHDYLGWMNDRVESDEQMWETGKRDLNALLGYFEREGLLESLKKGHVLDVGCGVGRIIGPASKHFAKASGTDISPSAISKARELLADSGNVSFELGDGQSLAQFGDESIDLVYSFGVLCNMPVDCCAGYLREINRVLKRGSYASLQVFLGKCQPTLRQDTVAFRSFLEENFETAVSLCGFELLAADELLLDADTPDDGWLRPRICAIRKIAAADCSSSDLAAALYPEGEKDADDSWPGSQTEYLLSVKRAIEFYDQGRKREAHDALVFALTQYKDPEPRLEQLLAQLKEELSL